MIFYFEHVDDQGAALDSRHFSSKRLTQFAHPTFEYFHPRPGVGVENEHERWMIVLTGEDFMPAEWEPIDIFGVSVEALWGALPDEKMIGIGYGR